MVDMVVENEDREEDEARLVSDSVGCEDDDGSGEREGECC